ncbi:MAG: hydrogenase maturation protease [Armatimonadetes bacterium]|nr:hydrogenase maturation protease [Armatimonadota bacterium]
MSLIIGVGNEYRRDDGAGFAAARRLRAENPDVPVVLQSGDGVSLMEAWRDADSVIVVDAVHSAGKPGSVHRFDAAARPIPAKFFPSSTHAFGLAEAVEMARALGRLPERLIVYGIEGKTFEAGTGLSPEVEEGVSQVVEQVLREIC